MAFLQGQNRNTIQTNAWQWVDETAGSKLITHQVRAGAAAKRPEVNTNNSGLEITIHHYKREAITTTNERLPFYQSGSPGHERQRWANNRAVSTAKQMQRGCF